MVPKNESFNTLHSPLYWESSSHCSTYKHRENFIFGGPKIRRKNRETRETVYIKKGRGQEDRNKNMNKRKSTTRAKQQTGSSRPADAAASHCLGPELYLRQRLLKTVSHNPSSVTKPIYIVAVAISGYSDYYAGAIQCSYQGSLGLVRCARKFGWKCIVMRDERLG